MSALPSALQSSLAGQLAALNAQLAPTPLRVLPPFKAVPPPEDPTVTVSLRVALEAVTALRSEAAGLKAAAMSGRGSTDDLAAAWYRYEGAQAALNALAPLVESAVEENTRRRAEWRREQGRG